MEKPLLSGDSDKQFRAYLKEALEMINSERNEFHWKRAIYQGQVLLLAIFTAVLLIAYIMLWRDPDPKNISEILGSWKFLGQIFILGAIGGVVSTLQSERSLGEGVTSWYYSRIGLLVKPIIGAVGAVMIFFLFRSRLLFDVEDGTATTNNAIVLRATPFYFYYILAFLSGFSERFLTGTVAQLEGRLSGQQTPQSGSQSS